MGVSIKGPLALSQLFLTLRKRFLLALNPLVFRPRVLRYTYTVH